MSSGKTIYQCNGSNIITRNADFITVIAAPNYSGAKRHSLGSSAAVAAAGIFARDIAPFIRQSFSEKPLRKFNNIY
jgi:hypothetical protein